MAIRTLILFAAAAAGCLTEPGFASRSLNADESRESESRVLENGVQLTLVAQHPDLVTPTGVDVDEQGRIWIVATHTHFRPQDYVGPEFDEILIFTKDLEGKPAGRHVFFNGTKATMDLELGPEGWVYLAERDRILRVRDGDGDNRGDENSDLITLATEADYPHNGLEALSWHPEGDLVFALGENFGKPWTLTGADGSEVKGTGEGGVFRCSADGRQLRRIARGFWNPFGVCVRSDGEIFAAENDPGERPPCRLLHVVEGGDYGYQQTYGPEAHHPFVAWNGELRGTLPMIHPCGEAPCGVTPLGGGLLVPSWGDHRIDFFRLTRKGASFASERMALVTGGKYFRPCCIAADPRTEAQTSSIHRWYLTDWVDGRYDAHGFGRLWKLQIDTRQADWIGPLVPEPANTAALLAQQLRAGTAGLDQSELFQKARDEDPFISRAALQQLSLKAPTWMPDAVQSWPEADRIQAVLALKLSAAVADDWVRLFLADSSTEVQFETLRWIADADLRVCLPDIERYLNRRDLNYQRFEAAVATYNTLSGKPESGIRNVPLLLTRLKDPESAPELRAWALRLLPTLPLAAPKDGELSVQKFPEGLTLPMLEELLTLNNAVLAREVVHAMALDLNQSQAVLTRVARDESASPSLRADAIAGLSPLAEEQIDLLLELARASISPVRNEALRSLRTLAGSKVPEQQLRSIAEEFPESAELVQAIIAPTVIRDGRPQMTDTEAWQSLLNSVDGPAEFESGERLFHHPRLTQCSRCHRHSGRGNVVGPDLSRVSQRNDSAWLLQSILEPSRQMAPEYLPRTIVLKDGRVFTGIRLRSYTHETIRDANGQNRTFDRNDVESIAESAISFMPSDIISLLTNRELRDLLAFLESSR